MPQHVTCAPVGICRCLLLLYNMNLTATLKRHQHPGLIVDHILVILTGFNPPPPYHVTVARASKPNALKVYQTSSPGPLAAFSVGVWVAALSVCQYRHDLVADPMAISQTCISKPLPEISARPPLSPTRSHVWAGSERLLCKMPVGKRRRVVILGFLYINRESPRGFVAARAMLLRTPLCDHTVT